MARVDGTAGNYSAVWSVSNMGAATKNSDDKTFFLAYVSQNGGADAYFRELINAERPSVKASSITLTGGGQTPSIQAPVLFAADNGPNSDRGTSTTQQNNVPYIRSRVVLYDSNDSTYTTALAEYDVTSYTASSTTVALNKVSGTTTPAAGPYRAIIYYNYLKLSQALHTLDWTDENGIAKTTDSIGDNSVYSGTSNNMVINGVYSTSATYSRVDNGSTLSFGDTLLVEPGSTGSALNPYSPQTELPLPPSGAITPFGFDRSPAELNPGSGGICYPPIDAPADPALSALAVEDSSLYGRSGGTLNKAEGNYDMYFGGKDLSNIGEASITVTRGLMFDFPSGSYDDIITTPAFTSLPKFSADSYTHKIRVELTPYIGEPNNTSNDSIGTGLFSRSEVYDYNDPYGDNAPNPYIYNDVAIYYSTLEPVKEALYLFAKGTSANPTSEDDISLISISSVTFT